MGNSKWQVDNKGLFRIDTKALEKYYNSVVDTPLSTEKEKIEEFFLMPYFQVSNNMNVLDLGCGSGRWAKLIGPKCRKYVGVDFSKSLLEKAKREVNSENVSFVYGKAQEYYSQEKFDYILVIGLITYLNDGDVRQLSKNCRKMLGEKGKLVLRNVTVNDSEPGFGRKYYVKKPNLLQKLIGLKSFRRCGTYQLIRRTKDEEIKLFSEFKLVCTQMIGETGMRFYIFE